MGDQVNEEAILWAREQPIGGPAEYAVLLILAIESGEAGMCRLSRVEIAQKAATDTATVGRILDRLKGRGLVSWISGAGRARNTYQLPLPVVGGQYTHYTTPNRP